MIIVFKIFILFTTLVITINAKDWMIDETVPIIFIQKKDLSICNGFNQFSSYHIMDSLKTYFWKNQYWFLAEVPHPIDVAYSELFAYDSEKKEIIKVTNHRLPYSLYLSIAGINFANNKIILEKIDKRNDPIGHTLLLVIDGINKKVEKTIKFKNSSVINKVFQRGKNIIIELQPYTRRINWFYLISFWMPRGVPSKWIYYPSGKKIYYILDEKFNIINTYRKK